jgi:hypothetical protein
VTAVFSTAGAVVAVTSISVKYVLTGNTELNISIARVTVVPMPFKNKDNPGLRQRTIKPVQIHAAPVPPQRTPMQWLEIGTQTRRHERRGWLRRWLIHFGLLEDNDEAVWRRVISDYTMQVTYIEGMKGAKGKETFVDPRAYKGIRGAGGVWVSGKSETQVGIPKNHYTIPYLLYAYDVSRTSFQRRVKQAKQGKPFLTPSKPHKHKGASVIDNLQLSKAKHTPRFFFARTHAMSADIIPPENKAWNCYKEKEAYWCVVWDEKEAKGEDLTHWHRMAREHEARQPFIKQDLVSILETCCTTSYRALAVRINGWCAASTIETWLKSHPTYSMYAKNIKPGLTDDNKVKQVLFAQRVHRKWDLPPTVTKILWIHSDEKVTLALNITLTITPSLTFALSLTSPLPLSPP